MDTIPLGKVCSKCGTLKSQSAFPPSKQNPDGLFSYCRDCRTEYDRIRHAEKADQYRAYDQAYREVNRERRRAYARAHYQQTSEQQRAHSTERYRADPDRAKAASRASRRKNPVLNRLQSKQWAEQNPEKAHAITKRWRDQNPARVRVNKRNYRARRHMADGRFTDQEWTALCDRYQGKCLACGEQKPLTADHVVPLTKGGTNYISNIQPLCVECNSAKHTRIIDYRPCDDV